MVPGAIVASKYRVEALLGEGAMGEVWSAAHLVTGRRFAIKFLAADVVASLELRERMVTESKAAGGIVHRNVLEIYDVGEDAGVPFLVMQLLEGESLAERLDRGPLDQGSAVRIAVQVARGLGAAHEAGVVHRDIKPANVFLHRDGQEEIVKLLDFGVSKLLAGASASDGGASVTGLAVGSPAYMSPEQARGDHRSTDGRSDVWALGVLTFEMVAGRRPFQGATAFDIVAEILKGELPSLAAAVPGADPALEAFVAGCLQRDRARRFVSADEARLTLERFGSDDAEPKTQLWRPAPVPSRARSIGTPATVASSTVTPATSPSLNVEPRVPVSSQAKIAGTVLAALMVLIMTTVVVVRFVTATNLDPEAPPACTGALSDVLPWFLASAGADDPPSAVDAPATSATAPPSAEVPPRQEPPARKKQDTPPKRVAPRWDELGAPPADWGRNRR